MFQAAVTISLVPEARGGPFVFWDDLEAGCARAAALGFHAVEIFPPSAEDLDGHALRKILTRHNLKLAAIGTGAGWVRHKLTLTSDDPVTRRRARDSIKALLDFAGGHGAPIILGSMQGRAQGDITRAQAFDFLREALEQFGPRAHAFGVPLLIEPLNRYETNLVNSLADAAELLAPLRTQNIRVLCDLFHMNIEEADLAASIRRHAALIGHVHFADSNRRAIGFGHTEVAPIVQALRDIGYRGYLSAEVLPLPDSETAAAQTMKAFRQFAAST